MIARPQFVSALVLTMALYGTAGFADEPMGPYDEADASPAMTSQDTSAPPAAAGESSADATAIQSPSEPAAVPVRDESVIQAPVMERTAATENLNVYGQRKTEDEFITEDVVNALRNDSRIHGKIGVDTFRKVVTLTGRVTTPGQVDRISHVARGAVARDVEIRNDVRSIVNS
jgi:hypothetical protein